MNVPVIHKLISKTLKNFHTPLEESSLITIKTSKQSKLPNNQNFQAIKTSKNSQQYLKHLSISPFTHSHMVNRDKSEIVEETEAHMSSQRKSHEVGQNQVVKHSSVIVVFGGCGENVDGRKE